MSLQRLCDIHGGKLDDNVMNYATVSGKNVSKDICIECLSSSLRITLPGGMVVSGLDALTGTFTPAPPAAPVPYDSNPVLDNKPKDKYDDNPSNHNG